MPSCFYPGDLVTRMGDWEISTVSRRLLDYPGELACMYIVSRFPVYCFPLIVTFINLWLFFVIIKFSYFFFARTCFSQSRISFKLILKLALEFVFLFLEPSWDSYAGVTRFFDVV